MKKNFFWLKSINDLSLSGVLSLLLINKAFEPTKILQRKCILQWPLQGLAFILSLTTRSGTRSDVRCIGCYTMVRQKKKKKKKNEKPHICFKLFSNRTPCMVWWRSPSNHLHMYFLEKLPTFDVGLLENVSDHSRQYWIDISKKNHYWKKNLIRLQKSFARSIIFLVI